MADPWLVAIFVAGLLALWPGRQRLRTVAPFMLGVVVVFLCVKGGLLDRALRASHLDPAFAASRRSALGIAHGVVCVRSDAGGASLLARQQSRTVRPRSCLSRPLAPESALVTASRSLDTVRNFLRTHEFGFPVEAAERDGRTAVRWSDLRYCWRTAHG